MQELYDKLKFSEGLINASELETLDLLKLEWNSITNQFVALDLFKATFSSNNLCWSLTEKARKLYAVQTALKVQIILNYHLENETFNC